MPIKLNANSAQLIDGIPGATAPDAFAVVENVAIESDDTVTYALHLYASEADYEKGVQPFGVVTGNINVPSLKNKILADVRSKASLASSSEA